MTRYPQAATIGRADCAEVRVVYYTASAAWCSPSDRSPGAQVQHYVTCDHRHPTAGLATRCGERLARKAAAAYQTEVNVAYPLVPCDRQVHEEGEVFGASRYLAWCKSHLTHGGRLYLTREGAEASEWVCPWAALVTVGAGE